MYRTATDLSIPPAQGLTPLHVSTSELMKKDCEGKDGQGYSRATTISTATDKQMMTTTDVTKATSSYLVSCTLVYE